MRWADILRGHVGGAAFWQVAEARGWGNKLQVLKHVLRRVEVHFEAEAAQEAKADGQAPPQPGSHHAPAFLAEEVDSATESEVELAVLDGEHEGFVVDGTGLGPTLLGAAAGKAHTDAAGGRQGGGSSKSRKKKRRAAAKRRVAGKVDALAAELRRRGWASCDGFISPEAVDGLRAEIAQLRPHFETAKIWVGKGAGVGAEIERPDVRGDRVLWMCGGHQASNSNMFDSAGEQPQTRGEIEPCEPEIKGSLGTLCAPLAFAASAPAVGSGCVDRPHNPPSVT